MCVQDKGRIFNTDLIQALELQCLLDIADTIVVSALGREESRGAHYRADFPTRNDSAWLRHTVSHRQADGPAAELCPRHHYTIPARITPRFPHKHSSVR
jgi:succinate dehydrogenase / fumarate reductase flavoprotein subunit